MQEEKIRLPSADGKKILMKSHIRPKIVPLHPHYTVTA
jgi:hypothetical protein